MEERRKRKRRAAAELRAHVVPCPVCRQMATTHSVLPPCLHPDPLGRQPRAEVRRMAELLSERVVLVWPGKHPMTIALQHVLCEECVTQKLCCNALAFIAQLDEATVRTLFECEGKCLDDTIWRVVDALGMTPEDALARARIWLAARRLGRG